MFYLNTLFSFWQLIRKSSWKRISVSSEKRDLATCHCLYIDSGEITPCFLPTSVYTMVMPPPSCLLAYFPNNADTVTNATISHSHPHSHPPSSHRFRSPYPNLNLNSKTTCRLHTPHGYEVVQNAPTNISSFSQSG